MKFKVGDKVRVKKKLISGEDYGTFRFVNSMKEYRGKVVTIHEINPRATAYEIAEDGGEAYWTDEMFEPIEDPLADKIQERNNKPYTPPNTGDPWIDNLPEEYFEMYEEDDPIKPSHYRKGEIDLYESWYRTYPFNEFRAGMQMIAERYMKRDKDNRIQDLDKAIYTLERLKEYEEVQHE